MLKPLTLSLSLAAAFCFSGIALAGGHGGGCTNCGLASPQGSVVSPQSYVASPQCDTCNTGCETGGCFAKKHFSMPKICLPKISLPKMSFCKPKMYTYEWVLKKKRVKHHNDSCGGCNDCATATPTVYATGQSSPQAAPYAAPQSAAPYAAPQAAPYAAPQAAGQSTGIYAVPAMKTVGIDSVPPAPEVGGSLLSLTPAR